ncbi:MAG: DUF4035 domain-containing protein [Limnochordia bacterium]|nr:DUF4035 domain-containing protein [Limnochordia bacterium]
MEWQAYDALEPIGDERFDLLVAGISSVVSNIARQLYGEKGVRMTTAADFLPEWDIYTAREKIAKKKKEQRDKPVQSLDEMKEIFKSIVKQSSNRMSRKGRGRRR